MQEWRPDQTPTSFNRVALLQLATARLAVLVRTCRMRFQLAPCLATFLRCSVLCTLCVSCYVPPITVEPCCVLSPPVCFTCVILTRVYIWGCADANVSLAGTGVNLCQFLPMSVSIQILIWCSCVLTWSCADTSLTAAVSGVQTNCFRRLCASPLQGPERRACRFCLERGRRAQDDRHVWLWPIRLRLLCGLAGAALLHGSSVSSGLACLSGLGGFR